MSDRIHTRIDPEIKQEVAQIFSRLGLSESDAIRMFYHHVQLNNGLPFSVNIPNAETIEAINEDVSDMPSYKNMKELVKDLDLDT